VSTGAPDAEVQRSLRTKKNNGVLVVVGGENIQATRVALGSGYTGPGIELDPPPPAKRGGIYGREARSEAQPILWM
jgi:hypothetical protein